MACHGQKRGYEEVDIDGECSPGDPLYSKQQLTIFNMSLCKLQNVPLRRGEPSLRRSVLIFNTMKNIEEEIKLFGSLTCLQNIVPPIETNPGDIANLDSLPTTNTGVELSNNTLVDISSVSLSSNQVAKTTNAGHQDQSTCDDRNAICVPDNSKAVNVTSSTDDTDSSHSFTTFDLDSSSIHTTTASAVIASCVPIEKVALPSSDIFADIDVSRYDFDLLSNTGASTKLNTDLLGSLTLSEGPDKAIPGLKNELLVEDLDQIMQLIVGI